MKATELIWHFKQALNPGSGIEDENFDVATAVGVLNRAIDKFSIAVAPYVDRDSTATLWLNPLKCTEVKLKKMSTGEEFDRYKLPKDWLNIITARVWAEKDIKDAQGKVIETCKDRFAVNPIRGKSKDEARQTKFWRGNFAFRQAYLEFDKDGLKVFHDGDFRTKKLKVSYVKCPKNIHAGELVADEEEIGYVYADGKNIKYNQDLEFGKGAYDEIVHIAKILWSDKTQDIQTEILRKRYFNTIRN